MPTTKKDSAKPGTSTSTGGAIATRNSGAATGGASTITISGSSSTSTSTETSTTTGAGKGAGKGKGAGAGKATGSGGPDTGDKRPHVYKITVNSTGQSGHAIDSNKTNGAADSAGKRKSQAAAKGISGLAKPGKNVKDSKSVKL
jgi:hypothetical protein